MFDLFKRWRKPVPAMPKKKPILSPRIPFPQGYTLETFRQNPALVEEFRKLQDTELWRHALAAIFNSLPGSYQLRKGVDNDTHSTLELGRIQGYHDCLAVIQLLAVANEPTDEIEQTYGANPDRDNDIHWQPATQPISSAGSED